ncbi:MAG: L,D-transpeptidase family protein, partial [Hyphomicrobiaceae bacterium]
MKQLSAIFLTVVTLAHPASATPPIEAAAAPLASESAIRKPDQPVAAADDAASASPIASAVRDLLDAAAGAHVTAKARSEPEFAAADAEALAEFYRARGGAPLWTDDAGVTARGRALAIEIANAAAYGLDPRAFSLPTIDGVAGAEALASTDVKLTRALLGYARHARGGRIPRPAEQLNSNLDRKPQMLAPETVLASVTAAEDVASAVRALHPVHQQFERLRLAYLVETAASGDGKLSAKARQLRANMEMWRWMWDDLGELHIFNNIPAFMQRVVHNGVVVRNERIVVGEIGKQSSVFSRQLKSVVLRPRWRVPESIMVHELWPSLLKGGGLMRQHGLEITTKTGQPRDWRSIDWSKDDIRNYHVVQPPGSRSAVGLVKFSFPSQHTIFMHDTPDKWMFNSVQRTLSHGCLRVRNPLGLAEIVLGYDKG